MKSIKVIAGIVAALVIGISAQAQTPLMDLFAKQTAEKCAAVQAAPLFSAKVHSVALVTGTNAPPAWLQVLGNNVTVSGVYSLELNGRHLSGGGVAIEYIVYDVSIKSLVELEVGPAWLAYGDSVGSFDNAMEACVIAKLVDTTSLENWKANTPVIDMLPVDLSSIYVFAGAGSRVDELAYLVSFGAGLKWGK